MVRYNNSLRWLGISWQKLLLAIGAGISMSLFSPAVATPGYDLQESIIGSLAKGNAFVSFEEMSRLSFNMAGLPTDPRNDQPQSTPSTSPHTSVKASDAAPTASVSHTLVSVDESFVPSAVIELYPTNLITTAEPTPISSASKQVHATLQVTRHVRTSTPVPHHGPRKTTHARITPTEKTTPRKRTFARAKTHHRSDCAGIWTPDHLKSNASDLQPTSVKLGPATSVNPGPPLRTISDFLSYKPLLRGPDLNILLPILECPGTPMRCGIANIWDPAPYLCCNPVGSEHDLIERLMPLGELAVYYEYKYTTKHPEHDKARKAKNDKYHKEMEEKERQGIIKKLKEQQKHSDCMKTMLPNGTYLLSPWPKNMEDMDLDSLLSGAWRSVAKENSTIHRSRQPPHVRDVDAHVIQNGEEILPRELFIDYGATHLNMMKNLKGFKLFEAQRQLELMRMAPHLL